MNAAEPQRSLCTTMSPHHTARNAQCSVRSFVSPPRPCRDFFSCSSYPFSEPRGYDCFKGSGFALHGANFGGVDASPPIPSDQRRHTQNGGHVGRENAQEAEFREVHDHMHDMAWPKKWQMQTRSRPYLEVAEVCQVGPHPRCEHHRSFPGLCSVLVLQITSSNK